MARTYEFSPFGILQHPWVQKADTKFAKPGEAGLFKTGLTLSGEVAIAFADKITKACDAALEDFFENHDSGKKLTAGERKKWTVYYPFTKLEDDGGNPTGEITFDFKQNAEIVLRDKTKKAITIAVVDAKNNKIAKPVFSGSEGRTQFSMRPIPMVSLKQVGVRLDFSGVQIRKMSEGGGSGFGVVEGYSAEDDETEHGGSHSGAEASDKDTGGDY